MVANLHSKSNALIEVRSALLHSGAVTSLPFDHVTLITLCITCYRGGHMNYVVPCKYLSHHRLPVSNIL